MRALFHIPPLSRSFWGWTAMAFMIAAAIVVPFLLFGENETALEGLLSSEIGSAIAVVLIVGLLALDVVLPVPSSLVATAGGVLLGAWLGAAVIWLGLMAGSLLGYWIGLWGGRPLARRLVGESALARAESAVADFGAVAIVFCRPVPVMAEASAVMLGIVRMAMQRYLLVSALSNAAIAFVYAVVGAWALSINSFLIAFVASIVVPSLAWMLFRAAQAWSRPSHGGE